METRKEFISRMIWLSSEINDSDKGNSLDIIKMIDYQLRIREESVRRDELKLLQDEIYKNCVPQAKAKRLLNWIDTYKRKNTI
jgi:hypothetical protein